MLQAGRCALSKAIPAHSARGMCGHIGRSSPRSECPLTGQPGDPNRAGAPRAKPVPLRVRHLSTRELYFPGRAGWPPICVCQVQHLGRRASRARLAARPRTIFLGSAAGAVPRPRGAPVPVWAWQNCRAAALWPKGPGLGGAWHGHDVACTRRGPDAAADDRLGPGGLRGSPDQRPRADAQRAWLRPEP